ncbi:hypothetical protein OS242_04600 [Tumebacillus sp. DT12]|uniref:Uncharacterized protein n=1 Tax=Tumebacillus lacus TaxID=2995335 RepID=A0ABT3WYE2_9BACL|nr:hypothetical protein [Tumebacillus lacus]MCX7569231.1 hypothetical protein [Tumebacillus lacus]
MTYDYYAFADYSGAKDERQQKKHIVLAVASHRDENVRLVQGLTRESLLEAVQILLAEATANGQRVLLGFDHSYSFPTGFYETVSGSEWTSWEQLLSLLVQGGHGLPPIGDVPREWAMAANRRIGELIGIDSGGPFWGANFAQLKNPRFPHDATPLRNRRLVEERCPRMKPLYQIGGNGAVGLQALFGIGRLARLRTYCREREIPLFFWPFDGFEPPDHGHVLVEVYPTLFNHGTRSDAEDARACAVGLRDRDRAGTLNAYFHPDLTDDERRRASVEGWVIGVQNKG